MIFYRRLNKYITNNYYSKDYFYNIKEINMKIYQ